MKLVLKPKNQELQNLCDTIGNLPQLEPIPVDILRFLVIERLWCYYLSKDCKIFQCMKNYQPRKLPYFVLSYAVLQILVMVV